MVNNASAIAATEPPPYSDLGPDYTTSTAKLGQATLRAVRPSIVAYSLGANLKKSAAATPLDWPTSDGHRSSLLQKKERAHLLQLSKTISRMYRQLSTSSIQDDRTIHSEVVDASRALNLDPGFT